MRWRFPSSSSFALAISSMNSLASSLLFLTGGRIHWFAKTHGGVTGGIAKSPAILSNIMHNLRRWDIYFHINPTRGRNIKARSTDVTHWEWIPIDLDVTEATPTLDYDRVVRALQDIFGVQDFARPIHVYTGRGHQLWLPVSSHPVHNAHEIERTTSYILHTLSSTLDMPPFRVDTSCSDLCRLVRMPGTVNSKTGELAHFLTPPTRTGEHLPISAGHLLSLPLPPAWGPLMAPVSVDASTLPYHEVLDMLTRTANAFLERGWVAPGRHKAAYAAARSLRELGIPEGIALHWITNGAAICTPPLSTADVRRVVTNAYKEA